MPGLLVLLLEKQEPENSAWARRDHEIRGVHSTVPDGATMSFKGCFRALDHKLKMQEEI